MLDQCSRAVDALDVAARPLNHDGMDVERWFADAELLLNENSLFQVSVFLFYFKATHRFTDRA